MISIKSFPDTVKVTADKSTWLLKGPYFQFWTSSKMTTQPQLSIHFFCLELVRYCGYLSFQEVKSHFRENIYRELFLFSISAFIFLHLCFES